MAVLQGAMLEGCRILSVEVGAAAPFASRLLADLGAAVVKVEPLEGDLSRGWDTACNGIAAGFVWLNRNKQSLTLNLKRAEGRKIFLALAADADVVLENFKPGAVGRLGIDYEAVKTVKPDIIYGHISGFGQQGPYRDEKAYDMIIQGEAGFILMTGTAEAPAKIPLSICDLTAGFYAALGIVGLLNQRQRTGEGAEFEVSMLEAAASLLGYFPHFLWHRGEEPVRTGIRHALLTPYGPYEASDGLYFSLAALSEASWRTLCVEIIEAPELVDDPRYQSNELRVANRDGLEARLDQIFKTRTKADWLARLRAAAIPCGGVNTLREVLDHPQLAFANTIRELDSPVGPLKEFVNPIRVAGQAAVFDGVPALGEHTDEILEALGYDAAARAKLHKIKAV